MIEPFLLRALLGGLAVALAAGPIGCFIVWQRLSYFGAAISHAALLGVALGLLLQVAPMIGVLAVCGLMAVLLPLLERIARLASDTILGILAHGSLALGLIAASQIRGVRLDLMGYLFGDILAMRWLDAGVAAGASAAALAILILTWRPLLMMTVNQDLAAVERIASGPHRLIFTGLLALIVAVAMQIIGVLLIMALLIIPAATARPFASTPERMACLAALAGMVSVALGLAASMAWDLPAGPAIAASATALFGLSLLSWPIRGMRG